MSFVNEKDAKITNFLLQLSSKVIDEANQDAMAEREKILNQAKAEIEAERNRAKEELRKHVAALAVAGAEKILERQLDSAANSAIVDKLVAEL